MGDALVLQSQENCPLGLVGDWATRRGIAVDLLRVDRWDRLPAARDYELGVILGSDASLARDPVGWAVPVLDWIREADAAGVAILGICFGAQALAAALGGRVIQLGEPEREWIEVRTQDQARVPAGPWLSVHHDAIVTPPGATELADNARGVQAFATGRHLGVQFHPEVTPAIVRRWVSEYPQLLGRELLADLPARCRAAAPASAAMFDAFAESAGFELPSTEPIRC